MLTTESVFLLAVDISILLYWLHKRPLDLRLEQLDDCLLYTSSEYLLFCTARHLASAIGLG